MSDTPETERDVPDDDVLAGEYALGLMPEAERDAFAARLAAEPALRALHAQWLEHLAGMGEALDPVTPPARVLRRVEARLFAPPAAPARSGWSHARGWLLGAASGVAVLVVALVTLLPPPVPQAPAAPLFRAEIAAEDRSLVVTAAFDAGRGEFHIDRSAGQAREGRALELWLIRGSDAPVSLGVLPQGTPARLPVAEALRGGLDGAVLAISDEPAGGSPTGQPTGEVLAVGPITNL